MSEKRQEQRPGRRGTRADRLQRDEYVALREAIRTAMAEANVSQSELSRRVGQTFAFTNKVLRGDRTIEFTELVDVARALGIDPADLVRSATGSDT